MYSISVGRENLFGDPLIHNLSGTKIDVDFYRTCQLFKLKKEKTGFYQKFIKKCFYC